MTIHQADRKNPSPVRWPRLGAEPAVALVGTAFSALLLVLTALYAGPLWRDETNSLNVAQMPSLKELWHNLPFESFPPLWLLLLRGCCFLGLADSDAGIRVLGLYVGLFFLILLWDDLAHGGVSVKVAGSSGWSCLHSFCPVHLL